MLANGVELGKANMQVLEKQEALGLVPGIKELMAAYPGKVKIPVDVAVEKEGKRREIPVASLPTEYPIYDIGKQTIKEYCQIIGEAKSIVVSGPPGVYEKKEFLEGTKRVFGAIASSGAFSLAGGGHTIAALQELGLTNKVGYIEELDKPKRIRVDVNLSAINRLTKEGEVAAVPGKVLASGKLEHPVTVAAFSFSDVAKEKIAAAGGETKTLTQLVAEGVELSKVKLIK
jgi:ribosomal protein L18E